jgi:hypothetical protein
VTPGGGRLLVQGGALDNWFYNGMANRLVQKAEVEPEEATRTPLSSSKPM